MMLAPFLMGLAGPIAKQIMLSLGVGIVTLVGVDAALSAMLGAAKSAWGGMPGAVAQYIALAGVNTGLSMVAGACAARVAMASLKSMRLL